MTHLGDSAGPAEMCGVLGVGHGGDTWDPVCKWPKGHAGPHSWSPYADHDPVLLRALEHIDGARSGSVETVEDWRAELDWGYQHLSLGPGGFGCPPQTRDELEQRLVAYLDDVAKRGGDSPREVRRFVRMVTPWKRAP